MRKTDYIKSVRFNILFSARYARMVVRALGKPFQRLVVNSLVIYGSSEESAVEEILGQAERLEKDYEWFRAAGSYEKALKLLPEDDFSGKGETYERLGYAFYRAAFQAEGNDEFRQRLRRAIADYEKAREHYQKLNDPKKTGIVLRCDAMNAYIGYWLASGASEKKRLLDECWRFTEDSLRVLKESGEAREYGETFNQLSASALLGFCLEWDYQVGEKIIKEVVDHGESGIKLLSTLDEPDMLAKTFVRTAFALSVSAYCFLDLDEKESCVRKAQSYWIKAKEASEDAARLEMVFPVPCPHDFLWGWGSQEALANLEKALEHAKRTRDRFIIGSALDWLAYHTACALYYVDDYDEREKGERIVIQYAEDAKRQYSVLTFISSRGDFAWVEAIHAYVMPGYSRETDLRKKRDMLEGAIAAARGGLVTAETSGYPYATNNTRYFLGIRIRMLAEIESNTEEKKRLLEEALQNMNEASRIKEQFAPLANWDIGLTKGELAVIKCELADLATDSETKRSMLEAAILERENGIKLLVKDVSYHPQKNMASFALLGNAQYLAGGWLMRLYRLTRDKGHLGKAVEAFTEAVESYQKANLTSDIAECNWKIAQAHDELDDHMMAASNFCLASDNFKGAAEKIPQLKSFYEECALYMQAWSEIEKARYHHERQEHGLAKEHFEKAAQLHEPLKRWSYLEPNYSAWARVEDAEDLSRKEQCEEAIQAFGKANKLFEESKKSIQEGLAKVEGAEEKQMATQILNATGPRREYCKARVAIEEGKILDKKGDHSGSSEKYGSAAATLQEIAQTAESEQEKKELSLMITLSQAWARMTRAEAEGAPDLYLEASELFEEAKEFSPNEKAKMLALGHSRFCRALEAGTKFADTRDVTMHDTATRYLESAANYYVNAGFKNASEYAKATQLLFDAYAQMDDAKREKDTEKKARLYMMAEKVLQTSAGAYMKAEHPEKSEQVQRLLEKVREERELATSLTEILHAPTIVSTTTAFTSPSPTEEEAVGLERLEHAAVTANLILNPKELTVGESMELEIELANAGKGQAILNQIENAIPQGFELMVKPELFRVEGCNINLKGRRLNPLNAQEVKFSLRPKHKGTFTMAPRITYLDENGNAKSHQPEPVSITVKELGIKGWIKGER
jgi:hypothetical protein